MKNTKNTSNAVIEAEGQAAEVGNPEPFKILETHQAVEILEGLLGQFSWITE